MAHAEPGRSAAADRLLQEIADYALRRPVLEATPVQDFVTLFVV